MELVHFRGLNCFHDGVLSIAHSFGLPYADAFAALWPETDFRYDPYRKAYLTKRLITALEAMGAKVACFDCFQPEDVARQLARISAGEVFVAGMDAFHIPWNPMYRALHGPHYFIVRNGADGLLACADPTYGRREERLARDALLAHTFDVCHVRRVAASPMRAAPAEAAREILRTHGQTRETLLSRIHGCARAEQEDIAHLAKYIDAMICNRYLYRFYLDHRQDSYKGFTSYFDDSYFSRWTAVKSGLYKAAAGARGQDLPDAAAKLFVQAMDREWLLAKAMAAHMPQRPPPQKGCTYDPDNAEHRFV